MSFMHLFDSGDFVPELIGFADGDGDEIRIMKVGGGTLGREYDGVFLVEVKPGPVGESLDRFEVTHGMPHTHWDTLLMVIESRETD